MVQCLVRTLFYFKSDTPYQILGLLRGSFSLSLLGTIEQILPTKLCLWPQWMLERPPRRGVNNRRQICIIIAALLGDTMHAVLIVLVKLPTHTPEDILNGNHKQLRGEKGNAAHQQTTNFIYMIIRTEIGFTDRPNSKSLSQK